MEMGLTLSRRISPPSSPGLLFTQLGWSSKLFMHPIPVSSLKQNGAPTLLLTTSTRFSRSRLEPENLLF